MENVSLFELIKECVAELKTVYDERRVELIGMEETASLPEVRADERMLRQAVLNLLRNAAEAVPEDKIERTVRLRGLKDVDREGHAWAIIEIEDSGEGIPQSVLQHIFIPFFTTKEKGHGIGLALAHRVITEHAGTLTASNKPHAGATFTMKLPVPSD
jgi:signal transduction histidine kinase